MSNQITRNCHFISRFLTKPWECGQRFLSFYDFKTDQFETQSSRSLFADDALHSPQAETWLGRMVEEPVGSIRDRLTTGDLTGLQQWRCFRAAMLMLWLQGVRMRTLTDDDARRHLDALATLPEHELDGLVRNMMRSYDLRLSPTDWNGDAYAPLTFPSTGVFQFVLPDRGCLSGHSIGIGLPIHVTCALLATPKENDRPLDVSYVVPSLACYSVGTSSAHRVVVDPAVYTRVGEAELRTLLHAQRALNDRLAANVADARGLVVEMFATSGINVGRDAAGRIPPNRDSTPTR